VNPEFALWTLGFRPFYLLASIYAALSIVLWAAQFAGWLPYAWLAGSTWHAHEMLFGFVLPVMVGFLLTAGQSWSGLRTLNGKPLMGLALLWFLARLLVLTPWGWLAAIVNTAFPLLAALALAVPLVQAGVRRNYFFVGLLVLMGAASFGIHASRLGMPNLVSWLGLPLALDCVLFIMVVMAGRIVPPFTKNGVPGAQPHRLPWLERAAPTLILAVLVADATHLQSTALALLLMLATLANGWRLALWDSLKTRHTPLVWVLHLGYAWIVLHLALRTLAELDFISASAATHALTAGAIGTLTLGMMTRTARGHTGRSLQADRFDVACYFLVLTSAIVRVFVPLAVPVWLIASVLVSALLWSAAFTLYAVRYWPVLTRARVDGKPG
jgi:uncharacterized protein involved in response to NO